MRPIANARLTYVWVVLSAITIVSWLLGRTSHSGNHVTSNTAVTIGILAIGFVKAYLIIANFMEVRTAPTWLRRFTDIWLVVFWGSIVAIYLY